MRASSKVFRMLISEVGVLALFQESECGASVSLPLNPVKHLFNAAVER